MTRHHDRARQAAAHLHLAEAGLPSMHQRQAAEARSLGRVWLPPDCSTPEQQRRWIAATRKRPEGVQ